MAESHWALGEDLFAQKYADKMRGIILDRSGKVNGLELPKWDCVKPNANMPISKYTLDTQGNRITFKQVSFKKSQELMIKGEENNPV